MQLITIRINQKYLKFMLKNKKKNNINNYFNHIMEDIDILSVEDEEMQCAVKAGVNLDAIREEDPCKDRDNIIKIVMKSDYGILLDDKVMGKF